MVIEQYMYTFIWDVGGVKRHQLSIKLHITYHGLLPKVSYSMIITYMNHLLGYNHVLYSIICHRLDRILENVHIPKWCFLLMLFRRCDASTWDLAYKFHEKKHIMNILKIVLKGMKPKTINKQSATMPDQMCTWTRIVRR